jgi:hypothetical protein
MADEFVYIVAADKEGPVKFGYSSNPEERLRGLQTGSPQRLFLLYTRDFREERFARFAEARIHHELRQFSTYGGYYEWFDISVFEASQVLSEFPIYGYLSSIHEDYERPYEFSENNHLAALIDDEENGYICDEIISLFNETFPSNIKKYENMIPTSESDSDGWDKLFPIEELAYFK